MASFWTLFFFSIWGICFCFICCAGCRIYIFATEHKLLLLAWKEHGGCFWFNVTHCSIFLVKKKGVNSLIQHDNLKRREQNQKRVFVGVQTLDTLRKAINPSTVHVIYCLSPVQLIFLFLFFQLLYLFEIIQNE